MYDTRQDNIDFLIIARKILKFYLNLRTAIKVIYIVSLRRKNQNVLFVPRQSHVACNVQSVTDFPFIVEATSHFPW